MRKLIYLLAVLGLAMTMSCGNSAKREQEIRDSLRADSIMKDSIIRVKIDSIRKDSMWRYRVTPDLATFELHGPVKSVKTKGCLGYTDEMIMDAYYSETGGLNAYSINAYSIDGGYSIKRNNDGTINSLVHIINGAGSHVISFKYNEKGYPIKKTIAENTDCGYEEIVTLTYDGDWNIVKEVLKGSNIADDYNSTSSYKIEEVDEFGNWTKRKKTKTYYEESGYDVPDPISRGTKTVIETRTITYYEK